MLSATPSEVVITDEELRSLTDAILKRHGIDFNSYEPKSLKRRIVRALHVFKLNSVVDLWMKLLREHSFIYPFLDEISVGLTSMFRDPIMWKKMRSLLLNDMSKKSDLSIWHAGTSSGEEVYTMGILLREAAFEKPVKAWATDISNQAMATAKKGEYHLLKIEEYERNYQEFNPGSMLNRYYTDNGTNATMDTSLISHVDFEYHNLINSPFTRTFDVIFCRNVMIYFDSDAKRKLFEKFHASLNPGGLFVIGFYDAVLPLVDPAKFSVLDLDSKIFQKV